MSGLENLKYLESHEWIRVNGSTGVVGISDHAQHEISDIVFVELPGEGRIVKQKENVMVIESVKAAFDIYSPVSGKVVRVNSRLNSEPQVVNQSPYEDGWLFEIQISDPSELDGLMDHATYEKNKAAQTH